MTTTNPEYLARSLSFPLCFPRSELLIALHRSPYLALNQTIEGRTSTFLPYLSAYIPHLPQHDASLYPHHNTLPYLPLAAPSDCSERGHRYKFVQPTFLALKDRPFERLTDTVRFIYFQISSSHALISNPVLNVLTVYVVLLLDVQLAINALMVYVPVTDLSFSSTGITLISSF